MSRFSVFNLASSAVRISTRMKSDIATKTSQQFTSNSTQWLSAAAAVRCNERIPAKLVKVGSEKIRPGSTSQLSCRSISTSRGEAVPHSTSESKSLLEQLEETLNPPLSSTPLVPPPQPRVYVISGPSGVGKDAVVRRLQELKPEVHFVVTATDRAMREGETHGVDYFFITTNEFEKMIADDELVEYAVVYNQYKGIPKQQIRDALARNTDVVLRLDVQGAATVRKQIPEAITIFLIAECERVLVERLAGRGSETLEELKERVNTARAEIARAREFDYVLVNESGEIEKTANLLSGIVDTEKLKAR